MNLDLFDVNVFMGQPATRIFEPAGTVPKLLSGLDDAGIRRAVVWHIAQRDYSPVDGNPLLSEAIAGEERLFGCWTILPPQTREVIREDFFPSMKANRIVCLRAFPDIHKFLLNKTSFGKFLGEISARRIPLLLSMLNRSEGGITWDGVYKLMEDFPNLTCILCDLGSWATDRYTWPLLESYPDVYLETSLVSMGAGNLEATVRRFGAERLVFGSSFPLRYPRASILSLMHSDIPDDDKQKIASVNLDSLISRVEL